MNKEEFSARIQTMEGTLYGVARTYLPIPADCADAVREAVLKANRSLGSLRREECLETWVVRILINERLGGAGEKGKAKNLKPCRNLLPARHCSLVGSGHDARLHTSGLPVKPFKPYLNPRSGLPA